MKPEPTEIREEMMRPSQSAGGLDGTVGSLEEPARAGPGPKTKGAEPNGESEE